MCRTTSRIELGDVTPHNIKQLKRLNQVVFPVSYNDKFYKVNYGSEQSRIKTAVITGPLARPLPPVTHSLASLARSTAIIRSLSLLSHS